MAQWHQIPQIAGVQAAAPIAMVGYAFMYAGFPVWLPAADVAQAGPSALPGQHDLGERERRQPGP